MGSTAVEFNSDPNKSQDPAVISPANRCTYLTEASRRIIDIAFCRRRTPANKVEPMVITTLQSILNAKPRKAPPSLRLKRCCVFLTAVWFFSVNSFMGRPRTLESKHPLQNTKTRNALKLYQWKK